MGNTGFAEPKNAQDAKQRAPVIFMLVFKKMKKIITVSLIIFLIIPSISIAKSIDLSPPISIEKIIMYRDGGTIGIELKDINNKIISFCIDGRIGSKTRGKLYIGSTHPTDKNSKLIEAIEFEEKLISTITEIINKNYTQQERDKVSEKPIDFRKLTEEELKLYRIFQFIKFYKNLAN